MATTKLKPNTLANKLRSEGVPALGTLDVTPRNTNPILRVNVPKDKYRMIWTNYDMQQCVARYEWGGLPNGLDSYNLERMLYYRGQLAGFKIGGTVFILPYYIQGDLNPYGLPVKIKPQSYNGRPVAGKNDFFRDGLELDVDILGNEVDDYKAVLLFDSVPQTQGQSVISRYIQNQVIINEMVEVFARININVVISNKKIGLVVHDPKQADICRQELSDAFASDCPFFVLSSPLDTQDVGTVSDFNAEDLFATIKNYDAVRCFMSGISSKGFGADKKERLISMEMNGVEEEKDLILDIGLELRQLFAERMNKKFGTNITVSKRADKFEQQEQNQAQDIPQEQDNNEATTIRKGAEYDY